MPDQNTGGVNANSNTQATTDAAVESAASISTTR